MIQSKAQLIELYRKRASWYDFTANLYYLIGFREHAYRMRAVRALQLQPGDTVVEIACGTGLNFELLEEAGSGGNLSTDAMIALHAMEYSATVYSNDRDFDRIAGVKRINPLG